MRTKVVLVDSDVEFVEKLRTSLEQNGVEVLEVAYDGVSGLNLINKYQPDAAIIEMFLPDLDGIGICEATASQDTRIIILSSVKPPALVEKAFRLGIEHYMLKPCNIEQIVNRINNTRVMTREVSTATKNKAVDEKISNIFITVGIPAHIKGYQFLREAIKLAIEDPEIINCITKKLYPAIANKFATSPSKVERAIRHAIEVAWSRGRIENINALFGVRVYSSSDRPTNGEFIALVADKMLLEAI